MPTAIEPQILGTSSLTSLENETPDQLRHFSRSPHPYHRQQSDIHSHTEHSRQLTEACNERSNSSPVRVSSQTGIEQEGGAQIGAGSRRWQDSSKSPSDSGTEADDEGNGLLKGLPAPPHRARKGLRDAKGGILATTPSPLLTPPYLEADRRALRLDNIGELRGSAHARHRENEEVEKARERFRKRRRAELIRRSSEVLLLGIIGCIVYRGFGVTEAGRNGGVHPSNVSLEKLFADIS